jgi:hypothetical protein
VTDARSIERLPRRGQELAESEESSREWDDLEGSFQGVHFDAKPAAEHFADLEKIFERAERDEAPEIVEIHDRLSEIVSRDAPVKERLVAVIACLKAYDRRPVRQ